MEPRPPSASQSVLTRWLGIGDSNTAGFVHGGVIMRNCDEVAGIAAVRHSGCRVVTAAMDRMTFIHPVHVGQLVAEAHDHAAVDEARGVRVRDAEPAGQDRLRGGRRPGLHAALVYGAGTESRA